MSRIHDALRTAERLRLSDREPSVDILADVETVSAPLEGTAPINKSSMVSAAAGDPVLRPVIAAEATPLTPVQLGTDLTGLEDQSNYLGFVDSQFKQTPWTDPDSNTLFFVQPEQDHQIECEQFRTLRSRLYQIRANQPIKAILISSALPEEGKTFVSANLAMVIGRQHGRRVLLVDADLRNPGLSRVLGAPASPGLAEYLAGEADISSVIQKAPISNLYLVPSGRKVANPGELIGNARLAKLIARAGAMFDWVIVDSPPAVPMTDASLTAEACDGVVLVVKANSTGFDVAKKACSEFRRKPILGVVLNRADAAMTYGAYYYHQYGKATPSDENKS